MAITDLEKNLLEENPKRKERAGLHAVLAQAFINLKEYPKAIDALKNASSETRKKSLRGRYYFIIGQLFERQNQRDSAQVYYQKTIKQKLEYSSSLMGRGSNRKSSYPNSFSRRKSNLP